MKYESDVFKHYINRVMDLMEDSYKWKCLSKEAYDDETKVDFMRISKQLYELFMEEHTKLINMYND